MACCIIIGLPYPSFAQVSPPHLSLPYYSSIQPKTTRQNTIIEHTATRTATSNQLEVFLKVKQADNGDFAFLAPSNELHPYYLFLKYKHNPEPKTKQTADDGGGEEEEKRGIAGLLGCYSSSNEDDDVANTEEEEVAA